MNTFCKPNFGTFLKNIPLTVSGIALLALNVTGSASKALLALGALALPAVAFCLPDAAKRWRERKSPAVLLSALVLLLAIAFNFYNQWSQHSSAVQALAAAVGLRAELLVGVVTVSGFVAAFYALSLCLLLLAEGTGAAGEAETAVKKLTAGELLFIFAAAAVTITIGSKSSPIYPFNDWVDANAYMTVGRAMLEGMVPYRDLFEQKGPWLHFLYALAALISDSSFFGVYLVEIAACTAFLCFALKTIRLYEPGASLLYVPVLAALIYSSTAFFHGGGTEELCLPILTYAIYIALKSLRTGTYPTAAECVLVGATSALVLWIKYSMLGLYPAWFMVFAVLLLREKNIKKLLSMALFIAAGVLLASLPVLIYFALKGALGDLWNVYFYINLFYYPSDAVTSSSGVDILRVVNSILEVSAIQLVTPLLAGLMLMSEKKKSEYVSFVGMFFLTLLLVYVNGRYENYYAFIISAFSPLGLLAAVRLLRRGLAGAAEKLKPAKKLLPAALCLCSAAFLLLCSDNSYMLRYDKHDLPQFQFAEIINRQQEPTLLNYNFLDGGFYTAAGLIPDCKYYYKLNMEYEEMTDAQASYIAQGKTDFVVTRNEELPAHNYECVAESSYYLEGDEYTFYLYRLK